MTNTSIYNIKTSQLRQRAVACAVVLPITWPMKLVAAVTLSLALATHALAGDAETKGVPRPEWCRAGWVCLPTEELADRTAVVWTLRAELARLKARSRRLGLTAGCGVGVAGVATEEFRTRTAPAGFCGAMWGWRF